MLVFEQSEMIDEMIANLRKSFYPVEIFRPVKIFSVFVAWSVRPVEICSMFVAWSEEHSVYCY